MSPSLVRARWDEPNVQAYLPLRSHTQRRFGLNAEKQLMEASSEVPLAVKQTARRIGRSNNLECLRRRRRSEEVGPQYPKSSTQRWYESRAGKSRHLWKAYHRVITSESNTDYGPLTGQMLGKLGL